ncbi:uncharacterized protein KY384_007257 [Bacidia gigantensis]|uniref:uncharacterized protein n=1 Tax=Bacidia gigantensis TaxID=2732470 RepID=UPI001D0548F4|nr:uncharacterized protein KY384_007257 [Bacidia gigantensis]KAG8528339.1 hypothetical protein KY384_007257 [Bacidia gigantensis]
MTTPTADVLAIANLLKRERFYRDTAQWELCRATFHPDASATHINVAWYEGNVDEFLRKSAHMHKGKVNIIHASFDPVAIHVLGDRAISEAFCLVTSAVTLNGIDYELASHMRLFSRLRRLRLSDAQTQPPNPPNPNPSPNPNPNNHDDHQPTSSSSSSNPQPNPDSASEWRILSVESSYVRDRLVTAFPHTSTSAGPDATVPSALTADVQAYPKAYRSLALVMLTRGLKPRPDLPHEDEPDTVRRLADRNGEFLRNAEGRVVG